MTALGGDCAYKSHLGTPGCLPDLRRSRSRPASIAIRRELRSLRDASVGFGPQWDSRAVKITAGFPAFQHPPAQLGDQAGASRFNTSPSLKATS